MLEPSPMDGESKAILLAFIGLFVVIVLVAWSLAWYESQKIHHRRPNTANVTVVCRSSADLQVDCTVK